MRLHYSFNRISLLILTNYELLYFTNSVPIFDVILTLTSANLILAGLGPCSTYAVIILSGGVLYTKAIA